MNCHPVHISGDAEIPELVDGSDTAPAPERLTLTVTVSGLHPGQRFAVYHYSAFSKVPASAAGAARNAARSWNVTAVAGS